ncbi:MAG TPA: HAD family hydrolase [Gaiellaceae bacterium]|nr:HAD family hydrolase [Gaiellaceae bacterium]
MLRAVLFDWGDTLMEFRFDQELMDAAFRAGLDALGRDDLAPTDEIRAHFREQFEPMFWVPGTLEEIEYPGLIRELLAHFEIEISDEELRRFLEAEHEAWAPARVLGATTHAMLETLRSRSLKLGLVSNAFDPGWLLRRDLQQMGIADRIDFAVFSSEVGKRKPHPEIFERALAGLGAGPGESIFVGDRLFEDVLGAGELGMTTVQALWFRADENPDGARPDYEAFTQMDVLNIADRLLGSGW